MCRVVFFAPNVHTGGGLRLYKAIEKSLYERGAQFILDQRIRAHVSDEVARTASFFNPSIKGRLKAERFLKGVSADSSVVLCFHNVPPLFSVKGQKCIFLQNVHVINPPKASIAGIRIALKSRLEKMLLRLRNQHVSQYVVQTPTVRRLLLKHMPVSLDRISVIPFSDFSNIDDRKTPKGREGFVYVSDGAFHKNHKCLIDAWCLLAEQGAYPKLFLTLGERDKKLWDEISCIVHDNQLNVTNVGVLPPESVSELYNQAEALIFPSLKESFGLPLIEADQFKLPIIASELDYVRDVCSPVETFDPKSPLSIARSLHRFMSKNDPFKPTIHSGEDFICTISKGFIR